MKRLRVLLVTPDYPPATGGIQRMLHDLAHHLPDCAVRVVTLGRRGEDDGEGGVTVRRVALPGLIPRALSILALNVTAVICGLIWRPDVILSGHIVVSPGAAILANLTRRRYVQLLYASEIAHRPQTTRWASSHAAVTLTISEYSAGLARGAGLDTARLVVINPGIATAPSEAPISGRRPDIVWVARLQERYKGLAVVIGAMGLVRAVVPEARLVVIGDGPLRPAAEALARGCGVEGSITFLGRLGDRARDAILDQASCLVMPSRTSVNGAGEGFGIVYIEGGAHGLAVVAGNTGGALDAVEDGVTGLLVDPIDHVAVAAALTRILTDDGLRTRLAEAGRERARRLHWDHVGAEVRDLLVRAAASA